MEDGKLREMKRNRFCDRFLFWTKDLNTVYKQILQLMAGVRYTKNKADGFGISFSAAERREEQGETDRNRTLDIESSHTGGCGAFTPDSKQ